MSITEQPIMRKYRVKVSDRVRTRTVFAHSARGAISVLLGARLIDVFHEGDSMTPANRVLGSTYSAEIDDSSRGDGHSGLVRHVQVTVSHDPKHAEGEK